MKNVFIFMCLLFVGLITNAQEKFSSYDNVFLKKTFEIQISLKDGSAILWIDAASLDNSVDKAGYEIEESQLGGFIENLNEAKTKYIEWVSKAKENNVSEVDKSMELTTKTQKVSGYFKYGDWQFDHNVRLTYNFKIFKDDKIDKTNYLLIVRSGKLQSGSNQFMDCKDVVLVFTTADEITDFLNIISPEKITNYKNKPKSEELFK